MKFLYFFNPAKPRDFLVAKGPIFVMAGFAFAILNLILIPVLGINWGIDFAGGTEMQVRFTKEVKAEEIRQVLEKEGFEKNQVQRYGSEGSNEWLVRIERLTTLTDAKLTAVKGTLEAELATEVRIDHAPQEGDRFTVIVDAPKEDGDILALTRALDDQQAKLSQAVEEGAGLRLRRTRATDGAPETIADAVVRDEPYQGKVKYLVQLQGVSDKVGKALTAALGEAEIRRVDFVDATVAEQLKTDGLLALLISLALILVYVAVRFDIFFAPGALIALIHDPIGALCVYTIARMDFDLPSVAAMLTVIGYSINNTIVIYDRVRETMPPDAALPQEEVQKVVANAVNTTLNRTLSSTLTTLFTSVSVFAFTDGAVRTFAACLSVGITIGAFSSILMAPAIYLFFRKTFFNPAVAAATTVGPTKEERERGIV